MNIIEVKTHTRSKEAILRTLTMPDNCKCKKSGKIFTCEVLANPVEGFEAGKDLALPPGEYKMKWVNSPRFSKTLGEILGTFKPENLICLYNDKVPESRRILIHWGNTAKDTEGCELLGSKGVNNAIKNSRATYKEFHKIIKEVAGNDLKDWIYKVV